MKQKIQKVITGSLIFDNDKVLIVKRSKDDDVFPNLWELPGGGVEFGESFESALIRETKEEVGLDVKLVRVISVFDFVREKKDAKVHAIQINCIVEKVKGNVKLSHEHDDFAWVSKNDLNRYNISENTKEVISDAFDFIKKG